MNSNSKAAHSPVGLPLTKRQKTRTGGPAWPLGTWPTARAQQRVLQAASQVQSVPSGITAPLELKAGVLG